jgi:hypothetical protein
VPSHLPEKAAIPFGRSALGWTILISLGKGTGLSAVDPVLSRTKINKQEKQIFACHFSIPPLI